MFEAFGVFFFAFGLIIGSFVNVVIYRFGSNEAISGRSKCPSCQKTLVWYELIPVLSYLYLRGKCRRCSSKISLQYPIIELLTGFLFWAAAVKYYEIFTASIPHFFFIVGYYFILLSVLIIIGTIDFYHKVIPDRLALMFIALAFARLIIDYGGIENLFSGMAFLDLLMGPILYFFFAGLWYFSGGRWIGYGDANLALGVGWLVGFIGGFSAIILAFWIGALISIFLILFKKAGMKTEVPFAPFIIVGLLLVVFFGLDVLGISLLI